MPLTVTLVLPSDVEERVRRQGGDLDSDVREAYVLELFRRGQLSHLELSQALGIDRFQTDAWLKRHNVFEGSPTMFDLDQDRQTLERAIGTCRR